MPTSEKQKKAACAEYGRRKSGKKPSMFKSMTKKKLKQWCQSDIKKESFERNLDDKLDVLVFNDND
jgi:hypothetical protein